MTIIHTIKQANTITGGLSKPSKMRGFSYGLPAAECKVGSVLRSVEGTPCSSCYAFKRGNYRFKNVVDGQYRRFDLLTGEHWADAMVYLITKRYPNGGDFRWHDSGDIQGVEHLARICEVVRRTPSVAHWMPTQERATLGRYLRSGGEIPTNLIIRVSATMLGKASLGVPKHPQIKTSTVGATDCGRQCPAYRQGGACNGPEELSRLTALVAKLQARKRRDGTLSKSAAQDYSRARLALASVRANRAEGIEPIDCRSCWETSVPSVNYPLH